MPRLIRMEATTQLQATVPSVEILRWPMEADSVIFLSFYAMLNRFLKYRPTSQ